MDSATGFHTRKTSFRRASVGILLVLAFVALAGCSGGSQPAAPAASTAKPATPAKAEAAAPAPAAPKAAAPAPAPAKPPLKKLHVAVATVSAFQWPYYVGQAKDMYKDANIDLTVTVTETNAKAAQALLANSVDMAGGSFDPHIKAIATANADIIIVGSVISRPVYSFVVQPEVKSYADLKGKRVGVSAILSMDGLWMKQALTLNGLKDGEAEIVQIGGTAARFAALKSKAIAGAYLIQPQDFQAMREGFGRIGLSTDFVKEIIFDGYSTSRKWATANEELLVRFLSVQYKIHQWMYDPKNRNEAAQILAKVTNSQMEDALQTYDLWIGQKAIPPDAVATRGSIQGMMDALVATKQLDKPVEIEKVWDNSYMEKAIKLAKS